MRHCCDEDCLDMEMSLGCPGHALHQHQSHTVYDLHLGVVVSQVLQRLSCVARRYSIYLVANMADLQPCTLKNGRFSSCPYDGRWQFNTNVVFRCSVTLQLK